MVGDIDRSCRHGRRTSLTRELNALSADLRAIGTATRRLAEYHANVASAFGDATSDERNELARTRFSNVLIEDRTTVAVDTPLELRTFFIAMAEKNSKAVPDNPERRLAWATSRQRSCGIGGGGGIRSRECVTTTPGWWSPRHRNVATSARLGTWPSNPIRIPA